MVNHRILGYPFGKKHVLHDLHPRSQTLRVLSASELSPVSWTCHDTRNKLRMIKQSFSDFIDIDIDIDDENEEENTTLHGFTIKGGLLI